MGSTLYRKADLMKQSWRMVVHGSVVGLDLTGIAMGAILGATPVPEEEGGEGCCNALSLQI